MSFFLFASVLFFALFLLRFWYWIFHFFYIFSAFSVAEADALELLLLWMLLLLFIALHTLYLQTYNYVIEYELIKNNLTSLSLWMISSSRLFVRSLPFGRSFGMLPVLLASVVKIISNQFSIYPVTLHDMYLCWRNISSFLPSLDKMARFECYYVQNNIFCSMLHGISIYSTTNSIGDL